jgi:hypothetical protein
MLVILHSDCGVWCTIHAMPTYAHPAGRFHALNSSRILNDAEFTHAYPNCFALSNA